MSIARGMARSLRIPKYNPAQHARWLFEITEYVHCVSPLGGMIIESEILPPDGEQDEASESLLNLTKSKEETSMRRHLR